MTLLIGYLSEKTSKDQFPRYRWILYFNAITAYGMLISFPIQGYGYVSILFSTLSVFASYYFAIMFWKDLNSLPVHFISHSWFKLALLGNVISSAGPFTLAYIMVTHNLHQNWYPATIYIYLHFQYNIWFFFSCMGLLSYRLSGIGVPAENLKTIFICFALAALPAYFLSVLWWHIRVWLYVIVVIAAAEVSWQAGCNSYGWLKSIPTSYRATHAFFAYIIYFFGLALGMKLILQTASVIPVISRISFGFRPIVIGYLHLILLGIITIFILSYSFTYDQIQSNAGTRRGIMFICGGHYN